ncbi:MarR family transcriptional regulator [Paenibacillus algicola]|uniref:MarR family transcriptional regulator n=1 Tax=Paenibacillus algicola TaxID=2565926 RepID=A0A4P8XNN0_9BACL|nr:MarR family transcriptional regulator [Paenibacillus algicola]
MWNVKGTREALTSNLVLRYSLTVKRFEYKTSLRSKGGAVINDTKNCIERYIEADLAVSRRIIADTRDKMGIDLTREQFQTLRMIRSHEQCTSKLLSELLCVGKSSISSNVNRMEERGWIERHRDDEDRRVVYLSLTAEGENVLQSSEQLLQSVVASYMTHFEPQEVEQFITLFEKLAKLMQE